jgi:hypothetical protein
MFYHYIHPVSGFEAVVAQKTVRAELPVLRTTSQRLLNQATCSSKYQVYISVTHKERTNALASFVG